MKTILRNTCALFIIAFCSCIHGQAAKTFTTFHPSGFVWIKEGKAFPILVDKNEDKGVIRAITNLQADAQAISGVTPVILQEIKAKRLLIIGTIEQSSWIRQLISTRKIDRKELENKREKYLIQTIPHPFEYI